MKKEKVVYLILSKTNTHLGNLICWVTNYRFNHSSLALCEDLSEFYSFGRMVKDQFLVGGFIVENPGRYLANNKDITIRVYKIKLTREEYKKIRRLLDYFIANKEVMIYNSFGAVTSLFRKKIKVKNAYTCCEFAQNLLGQADIYSIREFAGLYAGQLIYEGSYRDYLGLTADAIVEPDEDYENKSSLFDYINGTYNHFSTLLRRLEPDNSQTGSDA